MPRRVAASLLLAAVACAGGCERAPHRRVEPRTAIKDWLQPMPRHALLSSRSGLGSYGPAEQRVVVDLDTGVLTRTDWDHTVTMQIVPRDELARLVTLRDAAWTAPKPASDHVTDYVEHVIAVDGDDALIVAADGPLRDSPAKVLALALRADAGWTN